MNEELEIFLEDCDDQLQSMENALVAMQNGEIDEDSIGAIFRAVHTIKGSAGMFGFDSIVAFTHTGENLFDVIRQGKVSITKEMVSLFLLCKDHVEKLIESVVHEEELDEAEKKVGEDLSAQLTAYIDAPQELEVQERPKEELEQKKQELPKWHISIRFHKDFLRQV